MIYFYDITYRIAFFLYSFLFVLGIFYNYSSFLMWFLSYSIIKYCLVQEQLKSLVYHNPLELFSVSYIIILVFSFIFSTPHIFWLILDFLKSGIFKFEYNRLKKIIYLLFFSVFFFNLINFLFFFNFVWYFLDNFNLKSSTTIYFFLNLNIHDFLLFIIDFFFFSNLLAISIIFFYFFMSYLKLSVFIKYRNIFFLINLLISTILTPPELIFQIILIIILSILLELKIFFLLIYIKINKAIN